jgi:type IV secretion system protein VirB1
MILSLAVFAQLAASCAPMVHVDTLAAIARTESGFHSGAINDSAVKRSYLARTKEEAIALATELVSVKNRMVDLGLMQVNSKNLAALGMTVADAFDPCKNINAGARVLLAAFTPPAARQDAQPALLKAISRYNTGDPGRGFTNGYVSKVIASAEKVVPAIRLGNATQKVQEKAGPLPPMPAPAVVVARPPAPWDVFGRARYARGQEANAAIDSTASDSPQQPARLQPFRLKANELEAADLR